VYNIFGTEIHVIHNDPMDHIRGTTGQGRELDLFANMENIKSEDIYVDGQFEIWNRRTDGTFRDTETILVFRSGGGAPGGVWSTQTINTKNDRAIYTVHR
jgi:hypothetical protein